MIANLKDDGGGSATSETVLGKPSKRKRKDCLLGPLYVERASELKFFYERSNWLSLKQIFFNPAICHKH